MTDGQAGTVTAIRISKENSKLAMKIDVSIGTTVERSEDGFIVDGTEYRVSESILDSILVNAGQQWATKMTLVKSLQMPSYSR